MFLLLCVPQLQDWLAIKSNDRERKIEAGTFCDYFSCAMVEWRCKWAFNVFIRAATDRLGVIFCTDRNLAV